ncbi:hypothetical protein AMC91_16615 (plasmid) [Elizabethkingia miricola]|jgi:hypothetical protein|nr:hypothetical protein AMC91_16615 [Elizabethkingia miricola]
MLRKKLTILFLLIAQVVILGHGLVPHHHHADLASQQHNHHHGKDAKKQHPEESSLQLAFSGLIHSGEQVTFTQSDASKIIVSKQALQAINALPCDFKMPFAYIVSFQKHTFPPDSKVRYQSPHYGAHSLRGPPAFIVA